MVGAVGGGGLGDLGIRYGYQRFRVEVMAIVIVILIALVQGLRIRRRDRPPRQQTPPPNVARGGPGVARPARACVRAGVLVPTDLYIYRASAREIAC